MRVVLDGLELPVGVVASITAGVSSWANVRGSSAEAKILSQYADNAEHALEVYDDANNLVARALVTFQHIHLNVTAGQSQETANAEIAGPARGGLPDGGFYV